MKLKKFIFKKVNSTNDIAIKVIKNSNSKFGMIVADNQKKGRGTFGKKWISYNGNLFVSIFFTLDKINLSLKQITKVNCFLIKKLLSQYCSNKITIKAPNDLFINKKKICGILQERITIADTNYMVVGIGINLIKSPNITNYPTTNIFELKNIKVNKQKVISKLIKIYENFIPKFYKLNLKTFNKI